MGRGFLILLVFAILTVSSGRVLAQNGSSASATATATIVSMLSLDAPPVMVFEDIGISLTEGGTMVMSPGGLVTTTGGVSVSVTDGGAPLGFQLSGSGNYTYSITLPDSIVVEEMGGGAITITDFTSNPAATGQLSAGSGTVYLGATITFPQAEEEGEITLDADMEIGVNFN